MELYYFVRGTLAWIATVAVLWPANVPVAALAYKMRNGPNAIPLPTREFWLRATLAALTIAVLLVVVVAIDYALTAEAELPAGPVHVAMLVVLVPIGMWLMFICFALEDLMQAAGVLVIYLCFPALVLYLANLIVPFWEPLVDWAGDWLKKPE
jgi:hypothetical protein